MKILFVASEGLPFSKTGGLADVVEALPKTLVAMGHEVAVVLPRYRGTKTSTVIIPSLTVPMGHGLRFSAIADGTIVAGVRYYFVDDPEYFDRTQLYGEKGKDYPDNAERFAEFCRSAIEIAKHVWRPDVIHCHDWQSALVAVLLRTQYDNDPLLRGIPVIFTIHNMGYLGLFPRTTLGQIGLPDSLFHLKRLEFFGDISLLKGGLVFSDYLTTVSRKYAQEIQTPEYGCGLDGVVRDRAANLRGILNGVDYTQWSPETDTFIAAQYSARNLAPKRVCKKDLLEEFKLPDENMSRALIGIVSRFADQKGFDLIAEKASAILKENVAMVALGNGEPKYEQMFRDLAAANPQRVAVKIVYDNAIAHKIEAGADIFLMPSRYEPCGLNQIYSLRYGTVPVVRATGGLDDTIEQFDVTHGIGTGFKFIPYTGEAMVACLHQAVDIYNHNKIWQRIQLNGMAKDFSWKASAGEYVKLYDQATKARIARAS